VYSQDFVYNVAPTFQCTAWQTYQTLLIVQNYVSLTISGSNDPVGITLTNSTDVAAIALALRTGTTYGPVSSNGYNWVGGASCAGISLSSTGVVCACNTGYTLRPCYGVAGIWGGVNGTTCNAATQTMTVTFQWV
jgi:hypothetical protein